MPSILFIHFYHFFVESHSNNITILTRRRSLGRPNILKSHSSIVYPRLSVRLFLLRRSLSENILAKRELN